MGPFWQFKMMWPFRHQLLVLLFVICNYNELELQKIAI